MASIISSSVDGYLGPYIMHNWCKLKVGNKQKMILSPEKEGPYLRRRESKQEKISMG
jgi:hypothetical protein